MAQNNAVKVIDRPDASAMGEMVNAELANQIATAKKHPRDEEKSLALLEKLATRSDAVAEQCMYTLKRTQKDKATGKEQIVFITGPSIHFMQLLAYCWGNMRAGARITEEGEKTVTAQGLAYDLQRNNGLLVEIRRGITTSSGYRFGQDMINMTSNAACSIAERNAIEDCIPRVLWWDIYLAVKDKAVGASQIPEKLQNAVKFFISKGAKLEDILSALQVDGVNEMGREHLEVFIGLRSALKEGTIDASKIFTAEAAEQRARLVLNADDDPDQPMTPVGALLNKSGDQPKPAAAKVEGDGSAAPARDKDGTDKAKGKGAKAKAGSGEAKPAEAADATAADPKTGGGDAHSAKEPGDDAKPGAGDDTGTDPDDADREDADLVARVEAAHKAARPTERSQPIREARGALERIAEMSGDGVLRARAKALLGKYDLDA